MRAGILIPALTATALSLVPSSFGQLSPAEKAEQVREAFKFAWDGYYEHAFPNDELHPVTNTSGNSRNGWGASAADALSTAVIMELPDVVDQILDHLATVDFTNTTTSVSLFETTIRYLGGMLSGYDLLNDEAFKDLPSKPEQVEALLDQSQLLADVMKFAFNSTSGVPYNNIDIVDKTTDGAATNGLAVTGTLILEWKRLSDLTGEPEYYALTKRAESYLLDPEPAWAEPYDGLVGSNINISTGEFADATVSWSGGADSFYEYLLKMYVYDNEEFKVYGDRWESAAKSSIDVLFSETGDDKVTFMSELRDGELVYHSQHLTCFDGGSFILGGQVFNNQEYLDAGLKLVEGCRATYASTATGIGPETFSWDKDEVPEEEAEFYDREGFFITGSTYNMRPEVIESYYYAYRATGDEKYRDWAWEAFEAIDTYTRTGSGFSAIDDVNSPDGGKKLDNQESFLFAEVMKYLYLIFAPDGDWQVDTKGNNKYVYNTEAHPVKVAKTA